MQFQINRFSQNSVKMWHMGRGRNHFYWLTAVKVKKAFGFLFVDTVYLAFINFLTLAKMSF